MKISNSLLKKSAKGIFWTGSAQVVGQLMHLVIRLILARLLAPADFGLVAVAMVVINFTGWFLDMGLGAALIQRRDLTESHKSTAFWANGLVALLVFTCLALLAPFIAGFFNANELTPLLIALSFSTVLGAPEITLSALFQRDFNFRAVGSRKVASVFFGGISGIILALSGFGVWALVGNVLIGQFFGSTLLFWQSPWRPKFIFSREALVDLWSFSRSLVGAQLFNYFNRNLDTILIGRFLDTTSLGLYNLGYQFVLMPLLYVTRPINRVLFSTFSQLQDEPERLRNAYLQSTQMVAFFTMPLMTLVALSAPKLIPELLGQQWRAAVPIFPFLCLVGLIQSIQHLMPSVFQATGKTPMIFRWTLLSLIANTIAFAGGVRWGIMGVAVSYTGVTIALAPILQGWLLQTLNISWSCFILTLSKIFSSTFILILIWYLTNWFLENSAIRNAPLLTTLIQVSLAGSAYLLISWYWNPLVKDTFKKLDFFHLMRWRLNKNFHF